MISRGAKHARSSVTRSNRRHQQPMTYRIAVAADAPLLADFAARMFVASYRHLMDRTEIENYTATHFKPDRQLTEIASDQITTFLAFEDELAGYAQLARGNRPGCVISAANPAELKRIYVDARWHGRGVAQQLLSLVEQQARSQTCDLLWLAVWEVNDRAIAFYRKNGFQMIGRQGFPVGSEVQSDHVMAKSLANELR